LIAPRFLDIHRISETHEHIGMIYWARPKSGTLTLSPSEHYAIRWCSAEELPELEPPMSAAVKWYCLQAIREVGANVAA
jgi:8-oxo-dGTP pyrophosphatase MutT (NUDIX family)